MIPIDSKHSNERLLTVQPHCGGNSLWGKSWYAEKDGFYALKKCLLKMSVRHHGGPVSSSPLDTSDPQQVIASSPYSLSCIIKSDNDNVVGFATSQMLVKSAQE